MKTLIVILVFFLTSINHANSLEYTVLNDEDTKTLLDINISANNIWHGVYVDDGSDKEIKIGYTHIWHELADNYLSYDEPVYIENIKIHYEVVVDGETTIIEEVLKKIFQANAPYNLLYDLESETSEGLTKSILSTRLDDTMKVVYSDGFKEEVKIIEDFDYRLNHYLASISFYLPNQNYIGNSFKSKDFDEGKFSESIYTFLEKKERSVNGVPYEYFIYEMIIGDEELPITGQMYVDPKNYLPILMSYKNFGMEMRLEDKEIAQEMSIQQDLFIAHQIPLDRDYWEIIQTYPNTKVKNIFLEIKGDYNNRFPTAIQQEVIQVDGSDYLVLAGVLHGSDYGLIESATASDIEKNLKKKDFDPIDDPNIINMATKAINGATKINDKVNNLLEFVSDYIEDDLELTYTRTVYDIIESKSGDCTEHSMLFNVLARSIGIPSREVGGYAYDYESNIFSGHAWNEVVMDGMWVPVDPTWNISLMLGHIKESEELTTIINNLEFRLALIEFENGEQVIF